MKHTAPALPTGSLALGLVLLILPGGQRPLHLSDPGSVHSLRLDAIRAVRAGDLPRAEPPEEQDRHSPDYPFAYYWLGVTLDMKEHRSTEAEQALLKGIDLRPNFPEAYDALGILYDQQQLYSKSEPAFLRSVALNPRATNAVFNLGLSYMRQKRFFEAWASLMKCSKLTQATQMPFFRKALRCPN